MKVFIVLIGILYPFVLPAQNVIIEGTVEDTATGKKLQNAVVSILKEADSTLIGFIRTDTKGYFKKSVPPDHYILLVTSPEYADYTILTQEVSSSVLDLHIIPMVSRARLLKEIIVTQLPIHIRGDTTEYLADSFRVRPNATVEDLLKELPGIQVDMSGKITAQGQTVQKILVDGDEFFSDDPTIATRNLRADAIKKVQVFDKKSDQSVFTGVDDGQKTKTINLELKEEAKGGYFGKLSAGALDKYYNLQAMINAFKARRKLSAFAIGSSTQETGFGTLDAKTYGFSAGDVQVSEETGGLMVSSSKDDMGAGNFNGAGLPESIKAGLHYSNKWNDDGVTLNTNYLFNDLKLKFASNNLAQNILENGVYYADTKVKSDADRMQNGLSGMLTFKVDSFSSLRIDVSGEVGKDLYHNTYETVNLTDQDKVINNSMRNIQQENNYRNGSLSVMYRRRLKKPGQSVSVNASQRFNKSDQHILLDSKSNYFNPLTGLLINKDTIDQQKEYELEGSNFTAGASYTHPLSKTGFLLLDYAYTHHNSFSSRESFDTGPNGKYNIQDYQLSNKFDFIYNIQKAGIQYRYTKEKTNLLAGGHISTTSFKLQDQYSDTTGKRNYFNFYPRLDLTYRFTPYRSIRINYTGSSAQPTVNQIQPLKDNIDPVNIRTGNPNLKPSFTHDIGITFNDLKLSTERYFYMGADMTLVDHEINESYHLDALGRNISQFTNTNGNFYSNLFALVNMKIPNSAWRVGMGPLAQIIRYSNFVELKRSITNTSNYRLRITAQGRIKDKLSMNVAVMPGYYISTSNLTKEANLTFWSTNLVADVYYQLPFKFGVGTNANADFRQKVTSFDVHNSVIAWNAYIEKRFLKSETLTLRASIFDILDQNKGYKRYQLARGFYEQKVLTWGQYGIISLTYDFKNRGASPPDSQKNSYSF